MIEGLREGSLYPERGAYMDKEWLKTELVVDRLKEDVRKKPDSWRLLILLGRDAYLLKTGFDLVLIDFDIEFFEKKPRHESEFSWLIKVDHAGEGVLRCLLDGVCKKLTFKHPLISKEDFWMERLFELVPGVVVFARYDHDSLLRYFSADDGLSCHSPGAT